MIKNLIIKIGRTLLDIITILSFISAIGYSIAIMLTQDFAVGLASLIGFFTVIFLSFFLIYLIIDIRDALVKNNQHKDN
ncbi:hypothetical protein [Campylobacter sp. 2014D-0216]|uniref:hypothetical protein n=1 Tax=Campylobacter sp. 2014D-0216 TaxID=1813595 RepID=UPI0018A58F7F|nr:hypothetical protein [Campylobacter sp. 2014D-0216]QOR00919.1 hypothetical protein A0083_06640 [Campylobacter sp. 2014D-0216]